MQSLKSHPVSNQNSLIFEYPFLMSTIKKTQNQQAYPSYQQQASQKHSDHSNYGISRSPTPQNSNQNTYSPQNDINDDSSIEFYDEDEEIDQTVEREIEELENEITYKLGEQYNLLREKLKIKAKERENVLRTFRELSTIEPLQEKPFQENARVKNLQLKPSIKLLKKNPLNTKIIKNRIIREIQESQNIQTVKTELRTTFQEQPQIYDYSSSNINKNYGTGFNYTFKFQNLPSNNYQTPELLKTIKHKEVKSITKIDHSDDLIRQMSQELRKMEFKKVQDIAKGKFTFLRKK